jgi:hypothetical protein
MRRGSQTCPEKLLEINLRVSDQTMLWVANVNAHDGDELS